RVLKHGSMKAEVSYIARRERNSSSIMPTRRFPFLTHRQGRPIRHASYLWYRDHRMRRRALPSSKRLPWRIVPAAKGTRKVLSGISILAPNRSTAYPLREVPAPYLFVAWV